MSSIKTSNGSIAKITEFFNKLSIAGIEVPEDIEISFSMEKDEFEDLVKDIFFELKNKKTLFSSNIKTLQYNLSNGKVLITKKLN